MIDAFGYRANIGIILLNANTHVFWAKRVGEPKWQFPQGGMQQGESLEHALFRELYEEIGLREHDVDVLACTKEWLRYQLPMAVLNPSRGFKGQKQRWFLLASKQQDASIDLNTYDPCEFDQWRWVSYWYPLAAVVPFKRAVYRQALTELLPFAPSMRQ